MLAAPLLSCSDDGRSQQDEGTGEASDGIPLTDSGDETPSETSDTAETTDTAGNGECVITECQGKVYECGDCLDNDGDDSIDSADANCFGPCDNNEAGFKGSIPGQNQAPCSHMDCYFDADSGSGNDGCYWSHSCDPSEPNPSQCIFDPDAPIPGSGMDCETAQQTQDQECEDYCMPLVPNGCDCFGCCEIIVSEEESYTVFLGTGDDPGTCTLDDVADPDKCAPCIQVESCFNPCEHDICEICIGEVVVPLDCGEPGCPEGIESCDPANNSSDCPDGMVCVTGCCYPTPE